MNQEISDLEKQVNGIAVIGLAGRFPGAKNVEEYWSNLCQGVESIREFSDDELLAAGIKPSILQDRAYVKAGAILDGIDLFDAAYFGYSPREAEMIDPQHRVFLECSVHALNNAGYTTESYKGSIGVFAGATMNTYWHNIADRDLVQKLGSLEFHSTLFGNGIDYLSTRVSYKLNLKGPSLNVQTACSTSLVTVHLACQSLLTYQCDMALAGGISIRVPHVAGYYYEEGGLVSPDGHCRAFDEHAQGTVFGNGVGVVVLKRLSEALADRDTILAVIKGSAINNDGSSKAGYTAPSVEGQTAVVAEALALADVESETIGYMEAHGTGTALGDPLEVAALAKAYGAETDTKEYCAIGSVKTNIGHLDAAAGIAGLIKVTLMLQHKQIPPSLNFQRPNPRIDFAGSPFRINTTLSDWPASTTPRRAGISSFGVGGTNAHIILEEAPPQRDSEPARSWQIIPLSAKTQSALDRMKDDLATYLDLHPHEKLADIAYTCAIGRPTFPYRCIVVAQQQYEAAQHLRTHHSRSFATTRAPAQEKPIVFLFPDQGTQYVAMAYGLYQEEPIFRMYLDTCVEILTPLLGFDLRSVLFPQSECAQEMTKRLNETAVSQPALFMLEYALAKFFEAWGVRPQAMIGYSIGEYVAACLAGVFSLEDALRLVTTRGRLMQSMAPGAMLAVRLSETEIRSLLIDNVELAAIHGPLLCVVSGPSKDIEAFEKLLIDKEVMCHRLHTSHAFHSAMMEPALEAFVSEVRMVQLHSPALPFVSNVTGSWITAQQATSPEYWAQHLRHTVRFAEGLEIFVRDPNWIVLEVGPGQTLGTLAKQHPARASEQLVLASLRHPREQQEDMPFFLMTVGQLWLNGVPITRSTYYAKQSLRRVALPGYPFEHKRYWIDAPVVQTQQVIEHGLIPQRERENASVHPLLGQQLGSTPPLRHYVSHFDATSPAFLADHRIYGAVVYPATAYLEMALAVGDALGHMAGSVLSEVSLHEAMIRVGGEGQELMVHTIITPLKVGEYNFAIYSVNKGKDYENNAWILHSTGKIAAIGVDAITQRDPLEEIKSRCTEVITGSDFYDLLSQRGYDYGLSFRGIECLWRQDGEALGRLRVSESLQKELSNYRAHPAIVDAALHSIAATLPVSLRSFTFLPSACEEVRLYRSIERVCWSHAVMKSGGDDASICADIRLLDENGQLCLEIIGLRSSQMRRHGISPKILPDLNKWLYTVEWQMASEQIVDDLIQTPLNGASWLIFADKSGVGQALAQELRSCGAVCVLVIADSTYAIQENDQCCVDPTQPDQVRQMMRDMLGPDRPPCCGVIHLWGLDAALLEGDGEECAPLSQGLEVSSVLYTVQALATAGFPQPPRLWIVTRGAQPAGSELYQTNVMQAPIWGLGRVIAFEHPDLLCTRIDLDPLSATSSMVDMIVREINVSTYEDQVAFRQGSRYVPRLKHFQDSGAIKSTSEGTGKLAVPEALSYHLLAKEPGSLESLTLHPAQRLAPGRDQVEIKVRAAGLNFADLLKATGLYPGVEGPVPLGGECAGEVVAVGEGVQDLQIGDAVVAIAPSSMGAYVTTLASLVVSKPAHLSFEEAATVPITFLTAYYGLYTLAHIQKGERVLIHAAAGGVGLAAIQLARRSGVEIYATAGNEEKRQFLKQLGIQHVLNSRTLDFADEILRLTDGEGVDVVLNSLSGEAIPQGLAILKPFGRFLDISKTDIYKNSAIGLYPFHKSLSYNAIDLDQIFRTRPEFAQTLLREILSLMQAGELEPLPFRTFAIDDAVNAFLYLAQRKNIGKIILGIHERMRPLTEDITFRADGTYLLTGGLGALGLEVATWMANRGARHLVLVGRNEPSPQAKNKIELLQHAGVNIVVALADVSHRKQLSLVIEHIQEELPPLRGVLHLAGRLDDDMLVRLNHERFATIMAPKVDGAWNLHCLTKHCPLDFFVLFSTAASILGTIGQGNYAAANAFLDALAYMRRTNGLPGVSINWGPWSEVGMAARTANLVALEQQGLAMIAPQQGVWVLGQIMQMNVPQLVVLPYRPQQVLQFYPGNMQLPLLASVSDEKDEGRIVARKEEVRYARPNVGTDYVAPRDPLEKTIAEIWQQVLGIEDVGVHDDFFELGGTSLLAPEMLNELRRAFPIELALQQMFDATSVEKQALLLREALMEKLEHLSEEEAQTLLERTSSIL